MTELPQTIAEIARAAGVPRHRVVYAIESRDIELTGQLGLNATDAARLLGISRAHFWKLYSSGRTPRPRRLGRRTVWSRDELLAWFDAGCPAYNPWQAVRKEGQR